MRFESTTRCSNRPRSTSSRSTTRRGSCATKTPAVRWRWPREPSSWRRITPACLSRAGGASVSVSGRRGGIAGAAAAAAAGTARASRTAGAARAASAGTAAAPAATATAAARAATASAGCPCLVERKQGRRGIGGRSGDAKQRQHAAAAHILPFDVRMVVRLVKNPVRHGISPFRFCGRTLVPGHRLRSGWKNGRNGRLFHAAGDFYQPHKSTMISKGFVI